MSLSTFSFGSHNLLYGSHFSSRVSKPAEFEDVDFMINSKLFNTIFDQVEYSGNEPSLAGATPQYTLTGSAGASAYPWGDKLACLNLSSEKLCWCGGERSVCYMHRGWVLSTKGSINKNTRGEWLMLQCTYSRHKGNAYTERGRMNIKHTTKTHIRLASWALRIYDRGA